MSAEGAAHAMKRGQLDYPGLLQDLQAEVADLASVIQSLEANEWDLPTPADPWTIRDQLAHLADTDELCRDQILGGPRDLRQERDSAPEGMWTELGVRHGATLSTSELVTWWDTRARECREALASIAPDHRIPWGPTEMSAASLATARLMETWAHGVDIADALGREVGSSPRLRHVARLAWSAIPYAREKVGLPPASGAFRIELESPQGRVNLGPADAPNTITGTLLEFCLRAVQRRTWGECPSLHGEGPDAISSLEALRAFA